MKTAWGNKISTWFSQIRPWREIAVLALVVMELSWVVPWYRSLTPMMYATPPQKVFLVLGLICLGTYWVAQGMNALRFKLTVRRWGLGIWLGMAGLLSFKLLLPAGEGIFAGLQTLFGLRSSGRLPLIPDEFLILLILLLTFWRGLDIAQGRVGPLMMRRGFHVGVVMMLAFFFLNTLVTGETPGELLYLFLFAALMAMGTARLAAVSRLRGGRITPFDRRWLLGVTGAVALLVGLASLVAGVLAGEHGSMLRLIPLYLVGGTLLLMLLLLSPVILVLLIGGYWLFGRLLGGGSGMALEDAWRRVQGMFTVLGLQAQGWLAASGVMAWLQLMRRVLRPLVYGIVLGGLVILVLLEVRSRRLAARGKTEEGLESALDAEGLLALWRKEMHNRWEMIASRFGEALGQRKGGWLAAARIRRVYAQLMGLANRLHHPRATSQTPLEFLPELEVLFQPLREDVRLITQAYIRVRYGQLPETSTEVREVEAAWKRVKAYGSKMLAVVDRSQPA